MSGHIKWHAYGTYDAVKSKYINFCIRVNTNIVAAQSPAPGLTTEKWPVQAARKAYMARNYFLLDVTQMSMSKITSLRTVFLFLLNAR